MKRILIVDGHQDTANGLAELLTEAGHQPGVAATDHHCRTLLSHEPAYDMILLGRHLAENSDQSLFRHITTTSPGSRIILLSAYPIEQIFSLFHPDASIETFNGSLTKATTTHLATLLDNNFFITTEAHDGDTTHHIAYALSEQGLCSQIIRSEEQFHSSHHQIRPDVLIFEQTVPVLSTLRCCLHARMRQLNLRMLVVKPRHVASSSITAELPETGTAVAMNDGKPPIWRKRLLR